MVNNRKMNMKHFLILLLSALSFFLVGCSSYRDVAYFQNAEEVRGMTLQPQQQIQFQPGDRISIYVNSADPLLMQQFNLSTQYNGAVPTGTIGATTNSNNSNRSNILAYTVDEQGDINFPVLGKVSVKDKTRVEIADYIQKRLYERDLVKDPIVTVEYVDLYVNVLGEVKTPGRVAIRKDSFTILDAIAGAGDLTITGRRDNIMVSRQVDGEDETIFINLCDKHDVLSSPAFYLKQNDLIYVMPNIKRQHQADSTGNTFSQPTFWMSLVTFLITTSTLLFKK
jgi:polysaccharide export outer membrane protein